MERHEWGSAAIKKQRYIVEPINIILMRNHGQMYKTAMSIRMLVMSILFFSGFLVFAAIVVSQTLAIYTENYHLRHQLEVQEAAMKKFGRQAEVLNQYRQLEKELKKIATTSSMRVVYAKNVIEAPPHPAVKATQRTEPEPVLTEPEPDIVADPDPIESTPLIREAEVLETPDEKPEIVETDGRVPPLDQAATTPVEETSEEVKDTPSDVEEEPEQSAAYQAALAKVNAVKEEAARKAAQKADNTVPTQPGKNIDAKNLILTVESNNTVQFQYNLSNTHPESKPATGHLFIVLANPYTNPPLFAPFPAVPLMGGFPADYRKGTQFSIKRGKTVTGRLPGLMDPTHYNQAWVFVYSKDGDLLLKKHLISDNG